MRRIFCIVLEETESFKREEKGFQFVSSAQCFTEISAVQLCILGPMFFLLLINDMPDSAKNSTKEFRRALSVLQ